MISQRSRHLIHYHFKIISMPWFFQSWRCYLYLVDLVRLTWEPKKNHQLNAHLFLARLHNHRLSALPNFYWIRIHCRNHYFWFWRWCAKLYTIVLFLSQLPRLNDITALILHIAVINMLCVKYWLHHLVRYIAFRLTVISQNHDKGQNSSNKTKIWHPEIQTHEERD